MTDREIFDSMRVCFLNDSCSGCHYKPKTEDNATCMDRMLKDAYELIDRQQAEIERLNKENKILEYRSDVLTLSNRQKENTIAELTAKIVDTLTVANVVNREKMKELCKEVLGLACTDIDVFLSEPEVRLIDANEAEKLIVKMLGDIYGE